jgi:hypothetical protein
MCGVGGSVSAPKKRHIQIGNKKSNHDFKKNYLKPDDATPSRIVVALQAATRQPCLLSVVV